MSNPYEQALSLAEDALAGAKRKVAKLQEHLEAAQAWLDEAQAVVDRMQGESPEDYATEPADGEQVRAEAGVAEGSGAGSP